MYKLTLPIALLLMTSTGALTAKAQELHDADIKVNVQPIQSALKKVTSLQPKTFNYNTRQFSHLSLPAGEQVGFLASEVQDVFPTLVGQKAIRYNFGKNVFKDAFIETVDERALVPVLVAALKELSQEVERLKAEMQQLKIAAR
jgi:hypothetical protein